MAKKKNYNPLLPPETIVELVALKGELCYKKEMTYKEALNFDRKKGWNYLIYERGFCSIKENKK